MAKRILILAAGVGSGHNSAAAAIEKAMVDIPDAGEVQRLDVLTTTNDGFNLLYDDTYFALVAQVPWLVGWGYDNQDAPFQRGPFQWWEQANTTTTVRKIREFNPDVVIATHFLPARLVALMIARGQLNATLTLVDTDYDVQGMWLSAPLSTFFVAREETAAQLVGMGLPSDRVSVSGIPVQLGLDEPGDAAAIRERFGLDPAKPVVLISAGAAGGSYTVNIVRQVARCQADFQAVVVCGRNEQLFAQVTELASLSPGRFRVLGFTQEMPDLMRISSLFVGKPGGLSSAECMAAGLPMVIINPIPGQEVRNADYLLEEGAAVRCNYSTTVGYKIDALLANPARLAELTANARRVGRPNAARTAAEVTLGLTAPALWITRDAQRAMQKAFKDGVAVVDLPLESQLRTLTDAESGVSLAVFTAAQLEVVGAIPTSRTLSLSNKVMKTLDWKQENLDLALAGRYVLGGEESKVFGLI
ncbi:MAG: glycosyltransferase [Propionibacteriaceae bacterium]|nr:glycosyltransferase [Micropruina sp.]